MDEKKICRQCGVDFVVGDEDLKFLEKVSPEFGGKKYLIASPTLCGECSMIHKLIWRNESSLYKRKCDFSGKEMVFIYSPDKQMKVYDQKVWWSDEWNVLDYGFDFDFNKTFTEQMAVLLETVPFPNVFNSNPENSDYCNQSAEMKDSYLVFAARESENVMYGTNVIKSCDCLDVYMGTDLENCYEVVDCHSSYNLRYSQKSHNCSESSWLYDCQGCTSCFMCSNLRNKSFCLNNKQLTKEEYESQVKKYNLGNRHTVTGLKKQFVEMKLAAINCFANIVKSEEVTGDDILECKNCLNCFNINKSENLRNVWWGVVGLKDAVLMYASGVNVEFCYNTLVAVDSCYEVLFSQVIFRSRNMLYCVNCHDSQDCFGCVGLKNHRQYCVFNMQYTKGEYEELVPRIIEHMRQTGEWGEYLSPSLCLFAYNETKAADFWPQTRDEVLNQGFKWNDFNPDTGFDGPWYEPADDIVYYREEGAAQELLSGVIKCEVSGRPFIIMPQELTLYLKGNIPVPTKHPDVRHKERFAMKNPHRLWKRQCMCEGKITNDELRMTNNDACEHEGRCENEFETTYSPEREEKVYCEECYQKSII